MKKRIGIVIIYMLAVCIIAVGYFIVIKKEGIQGTARDGENKEDTKKTIFKDEREKLKLKLAEDLDDFLSSDYTEISISSRKDYMSSYLAIDTAKEGGNTLYNVYIKTDEPDLSITIMTDGNSAYTSDNHGRTWSTTEDKEDITRGIRANSYYISYVSFIYAALDAGLDYVYSARGGGYVITIKREEAVELDFQAINSELSNVDKLKDYAAYLQLDEQKFKFYDEDLGIEKKEYTLSLKNEQTFFIEVLRNSKLDELERINNLSREKGKNLINDKERLIKEFNQAKSEDTGN